MADVFPDKSLPRVGISTTWPSLQSGRCQIDGVQKANSGHPGMPLGAAPMAHVLWSRHLRFGPR